MAMNTLEELRNFYGIPDNVWAAAHQQLGQPDLRIMAALPAEALVENTMLTRYADPPQSLTPTHAVSMGLVWRLARRISWTRGGGSWDAWIDSDPWARPAATTTPAVASLPMTTAPKERTLKMSSVIDQSDDSEFIPENLAVADRWYQRYVSIMGGGHRRKKKTALWNNCQLSTRGCIS